eukprot:TRINITY_DN15324_c0_g1_i1.p1 TRINITY_DN15324_c0_g1~~TRINITY_DN15324_c0_g1_i1.p1  ORF type:complete len:570 (-),score=145.24 TRINITY_DN15324_c0_g1_i1:97-1764(-)
MVEEAASTGDAVEAAKAEGDTQDGEDGAEEVEWIYEEGEEEEQEEVDEVVEPDAACSTAAPLVEASDAGGACVKAESQVAEQGALVAAAGASASSSTAGAIVARPATSSAIVPHDLSMSLGEDGRLLRMFVARGEHRRPNAKEVATRKWLIQESFFDTWADEFTEKYAPRDGPHLQLDETAQELMDSCSKVLGTQRCVEKLEVEAKTPEATVHALRDTLLNAVKELTTPRRVLGLKSNAAMTPEALVKLQNREQSRLRQVVHDCLERIWKSGIGGEVLRLALESVRLRILKYENKLRDEEKCEKGVADAMGGREWQRLQDLIRKIDDDLRGQDGEEAPREPRLGLRAKAEGRGTRYAVETALAGLGGTASTKAIIDWIEAHPELLEQCKSVRLNRSQSKAKGRERPVWHTTVTSTIFDRCEGCGVENGRKLYKLKADWEPRSRKLALKDKEMPERLADAAPGAEQLQLPAPLADGQADGTAGALVSVAASRAGGGRRAGARAPDGAAGAAAGAEAKRARARAKPAAPPKERKPRGEGKKRGAPAALAVLVGDRAD